MKKPKNSKEGTSAVDLAVAAVIAIALLLGGAVNPVFYGIGTILGIIAGVIFLLMLALRLARKHGGEQMGVSPVKRLLAIIILLSLAISSWAALMSINISPWDAELNKFAYENTATALTLGAGFLTLLLSALQKDNFWLGSKSVTEMDERQLADRRLVFERSYKYGSVLVIVTAWLAFTYRHQLDAVLKVEGSNTLPGHAFWPLINLAVLFVALPPVIAALSKRRKR